MSPPRAGRALIAAAVLTAITTTATGTAAANSVWARIVGAGPSRYQQEMQTGDTFARHAAEIYPSSRRAADALALRAVAAYERAAKIDPKAAEPHYRAAEVLYAHFIQDADPPNRDVTRRALAHWRAFQRLAPLDPRMLTVHINRSLAYTKLADHDSLAHAAAEYDKLLSMVDGPTMGGEYMATWISNDAEIYMMLGKLDRAIALYKRALDENPSALEAYGLAVALDRDRQGARAREVMRKYAITDRLHALTQPNVFFVPDGEVEYYFGLGYAALGKPKQAITHYRRFIASGAHPRFDARARENIRRLRAQIAAHHHHARRARRARGHARP